MWTPSSPHTLRHGGRLLLLPSAKQKARSADIPLRERGAYPGHLFARWSRFTSERDFYRYAEANLRDAFPTLPNRSQFNRLVRSHDNLIEAFALHLVSLLTDARRKRPYQALDSSAMPIRDCKRGGHGWLAGGMPTLVGAIVWDGMRAFACSSPQIPLGSSRASVLGLCFHCRPTIGGDLLRCESPTELQAGQSVGSISSAPYIADKGFEGAENHRRWQESYGAQVIHPPKRNSRKRSWSKRLRRWVAGIRQIVETVYDKLFNTFGLWRERPHELRGLRARLAARVALHNFCIWLNDQLGRPRLAFADLMGW